MARTAVTVEVSGLRVSGGPASVLSCAGRGRFLDDPADGVALVVGAPNVVPFLAYQNMVALRDHLAGLGRLENLEEAFAGDGLHAGFFCSTLAACRKVGARSMNET